MNKLQKFLEDLVGERGFKALSKAVRSEDNLKNFAAPRVLLAWLVDQIGEMSAGETKSIQVPGAGDKFITIRKSTGETYEAEIVSHGHVEYKFGSHLISDNVELPRMILDSNGIKPEIPNTDNARSVMASVGRLADKLVKAAAKSKKQTSMEEDNRVHDSKEPEGVNKLNYDNAEKDKSVKKPVPSVGAFQKPKGNFHTQPFQKEEIKSKKQTSMEEDHEAKDSKLPEEVNEANYKAAEKDKSVKRPVPSVEAFQKPKGNFKTQPFQKEELNKEHLPVHVGTIDKKPGHPRRYNERSLMGAMVRRGQLEQAKGASKLSRFNERLIQPKVGKIEPLVKPVDRPYTKGEMPSGAGMARQPKIPKQPVAPSKNPANAAQKQAQASATGKQMMPKLPKQAKVGANMSMKSESQDQSLRKFALSESEAFTPCDHCGKAQFARDGKFDPCLCFQVEKHSKDPFVNLVKSDSGMKLEFNQNADKDSMHAFLLALKLGLIAQKINKGK